MKPPAAPLFNGSTMRRLMRSDFLLDVVPNYGRIKIGVCGNLSSPDDEVGITNTIIMGQGAGASGVVINDSVLIGPETGANLIGNSLTVEDPLFPGQVAIVGVTAVGRRCVGLGQWAGNTTAFGDSCLWSVQTPGSGAFGYVTLEHLTTGLECNAFGRGAGTKLTTSDYCNLFGNSTAGSAITASRTNLFGYAAMPYGNSPDNCGMGHLLFFNLTGLDLGGGAFVGENVGLGNYAGSSLVAAYRNTMIGTSSGNHALQKVDVAHSIAVGINSYTTKDYQAVLGAADITETILRGTVLAPNIVSTGPISIRDTVAAPPGGAYAINIGTGGFGVYWGSGAPAASAAKGSLYLRTDGSGTSNRMYVNTDGNTTWTAVGTAA